MKTKKTFFILATAALLLLAACSTQQQAMKSDVQAVPPAMAQAVPAKSQNPTASSGYLIQAGDQLDIKFFYNPELNESVIVRPDGKVSLQLVDEVQAAGVSPSQLDQVLTREYSRELKKPMVTVIVRSFTGQRIYVGGEVTRQGLVDLSTGMTALQAVITAGGLMETAKPEGVIVIRKGPEDQPIPIRVDLKQAFSAENAGADFQLKPYDVIYVPKTWIAKANKFVNQYVQNLLLYRGISFGFSYQVNRIDDR